MKKFLNVLLWAGCIILAILIFSSLVGIIYFLINWNLGVLGVLSSIFVSTVSSLLTILALLITVQSMNKTYELDNKKFDLDYKKSENENVRLLSLISRSLLLETIAIGDCLIPNEITHLNKSADRGRNNLKFVLTFFSANNEDISEIAIDKFEINFFHKTIKQTFIRINIDNEFSEFEKIIKQRGDSFKIVIVTNFDAKVHSDLIQKIRKGAMPEFKLNYVLRFKTIGGNSEKISKYGRFKLNAYDNSAHLLIFNTY